MLASVQPVSRQIRHSMRQLFWIELFVKIVLSIYVSIMYTVVYLNV